jgi:hypothetical protein
MAMSGIRLWAALGLVAALATAGCATISATPAGVPSPLPTGSPPATATAPATGTATPPPSPMPGTPVGTTASGGRITSTSTVPAVADSQPSAEAIDVLKTIPEPLEPKDRVPAPAGRVPAREPGAVRESPPDSTAPDTSTAAEPEVPIPGPTAPLGDRPGTLQGAGLPDSLLAPKRSSSADSASAAAAAPRGASPPPSGGKSAPSDTCWRVQVGAPPEAARARAVREAAESQLLVSMVIETEKGLHKVRTRDCLSAEAAESFRRRAKAAGFAGAFRFKGSRR